MVLIWTLFMQMACIKQSAPLTFSKTQDISFAAILDDSDSSQYSALPEEILTELGEYVDRHNVRFEVLTGETNFTIQANRAKITAFFTKTIDSFRINGYIPNTITRQISMGGCRKDDTRR